MKKNRARGVRRSRADKIPYYTNPATLAMYLVLRAPDDVCVAEIGAAAVELSAGRFWTIEDFTSLLETYYGRHGRYYQGRARLEIYWQDALLGSADLTLE